MPFYVQEGEGRLPIITQGNVFNRETANHVPELYNSTV